MIKCFCTIITLLIFLPTFGANILVYNDNGVDWSSLQWVSIFFKNRGDKVKNVNADFLINNPEWMTQYDKIVIPGGADCPYHEKLKGTGCRNIKKFVDCTQCLAIKCKTPFIGVFSLLYKRLCEFVS